MEFHGAGARLRPGAHGVFAYGEEDQKSREARRKSGGVYQAYGEEDQKSREARRKSGGISADGAPGEGAARPAGIRV